MSGERGSVSLLALAVCVVAIVFGLLVVDVAVFVQARTRAQVAADAAALAAAPVTFRPYGAVASPAAEAARLAAANGATLLECRCRVDRSWNTRTVHVEVAVPAQSLVLAPDLVRATSAAEFAPTELAR